MPRINTNRLIPNCFSRPSTGKKAEGQAAGNNPQGKEIPAKPNHPKYSPAEKGKAIVKDSAASPIAAKRTYEQGETSGTAHDKPRPGDEIRLGEMELASRHSHNSDSESTESFLTSDSSASSSFRSEGDRGDAGNPRTAGAPGSRSPAGHVGSEESASLSHYLQSSESETGWGSMTLGDYLGPLTGGGSRSGSSGSGSGSDVLAGEGFNINRVMQKNGRLANLEAQAMTPKRDPKFERTVENSPGYQRDLNPDNDTPSKRRPKYLFGTQSPFASLPPGEREAWMDNPRYMPKHELDKRYEAVKRDKAGLAAENTRLHGEVQALQGRIGEMHVEAAQDAKKSKLSGAVLGGIAGVTVGTIAGLVMGSGPAAPQNPQTPPAS